MSSAAFLTAPQERRFPATEARVTQLGPCRFRSLYFALGPARDCSRLARRHRPHLRAWRIDGNAPFARLAH
jgi:hypothetical protein